MSNPLLRKTVTRLARGIDRVFTGTALSPQPRARGARVEHAARVRALRVFTSFYARPEYMTRENAFMPRPEPIMPELRPIRRLAQGGEVIDLRWPSAFEPLWSTAALHDHLAALTPEARAQLSYSADQVDEVEEIVQRLGLDRSGELRDKYMRSIANQTAHARWFRHAGAPRPCLVLIHGYMGGNYAFDERMWSVKRIYNSGVDVVLTVLPLHGQRRSELRGMRPPAFPSSDPRFTIEGFRQTVFDHRALFDYLRGGQVTQLGVMGMSLGGYTAALLCTLESYLRLAVLLVPLSRIEDFAHRSGHMHSTGAEQLELREALRAAYSGVSPYTRLSLVPRERMIVVAGESDEVTGLEHGRALAEHFGARLEAFHGGHLLQAGREKAFEPVWKLIGEYVVSGFA
jgi:acetyl esterase/lipase